jgi:hypothetical protein
MPIFAKKKQNKYTFSDERPESPIEHNIRVWFMCKKWTEAKLIYDPEEKEQYGVPKTIIIPYKNFADEQPFFLSIKMVKRKGIDDAFKLVSCQVTYNGCPYGDGFTRKTLLGVVRNLIIGEFERHVNSCIGEAPQSSKSSAD